MNSINPRIKWTRETLSTFRTLQSAYLTEDLCSFIELIEKLDGKAPDIVKVGLRTILSKLPALFRREKLILNTRDSSEMEAYLKIQTGMEHLTGLTIDLVDQVEKPAELLDKLKDRISQYILELNQYDRHPKEKPLYDLWGF